MVCYVLKGGGQYEIHLTWGTNLLECYLEDIDAGCAPCAFCASRSKKARSHFPTPCSSVPPLYELRCVHPAAASLEVCATTRFPLITDACLERALSFIRAVVIERQIDGRCQPFKSDVRDHTSPSWARPHSHTGCNQKDTQTEQDCPSRAR